MIEQVLLAPEQAGATQPPADGWQPVTLPDLWQKRWDGFSGAVWYRLDWRQDCQGQPLALNVDRMVMAAQVFLNGDLLWQDARLVEPLSRSWNMPRYWLLPQSALATENTLLFRLVSPPHPGAGLGTVRLGTPEQLLPVYQSQRWQQRNVVTINLVVSLVLGSLFLVLWLLRRDERAFGWFALASLLWSIGLGNVLVTSTWPFDSGESWDRLSLIAFGSIAARSACSSGGSAHAASRRLGRLLCLGFASVMSGDYRVGLTNTWQACRAACVVIYMADLHHRSASSSSLHAWRTRLYDHRVLACCLFCFLLLGFYNLLAKLGLYEAFHDSQPMSAIIVSLCMFLVVAARFARSLRKIEAFNVELQEAVAQTRQELTQTLERKYELEAANIRLNERLRLTHDLHDSMGSSLMRSIILTEQARNLRPEQFLSMLRELRNDLRQVIDGSSASAADHASTPAEWIAPLRRRFVGLLDELGMHYHWQLPEQWPCRIEPTHLLALTRFLEEALINALKHSRGSRLEIVMQPLPGHALSLSVSDNGQGFDVQDVHAQGCGIGMHSMRMRIERIGGTLTIQSGPEGTSVTVSLQGVAGEPAQ